MKIFGELCQSLNDQIFLCSLAEHGIQGEQISSAVFDGAYIKCNVDSHLRMELGLDKETLPVFWDWMHQCGLSGKRFIY